MRLDSKYTVSEMKPSTETPKDNSIARSPVFYGWVIMAAGTFGIIMTSPGQTYTVSIFIEHFIGDLGISRSLVSTLYSIGTLIGSFALPFWGRQIDKRGARKMVVLIAVLFGLACIYMGFVQNALMLGLGFVLIRMLGQGSLGLVSQTAINQWWMRKRGMIAGISGLLMALLGIGAFPTLVYALISTFEWRLAYGVLGLALLFLMAPIGFFLFRNRPEDYHLSPDGINTTDQVDDQPVLKDLPGEENWTLREATRTRVFWALVISLAAFTMLSTGLFFHLVSIFGDRGLNPSAAASVFLPVALAAAVANLVGGFLTDRIPLRFLLAFGLLMQASSLLMAQYLQGTGSAFMFGIALGTTNGIFQTLSTVAWPTFFGRENLGSIYGFTSATGVMGAALGPLPFGIVRDLAGSYQPALFIFAGICVFLSLVGLTVQKPLKNRGKSIISRSRNG
jgi:MFS transporter, OFA family, oxalate/formate antiporter